MSRIQKALAAASKANQGKDRPKASGVAGTIRKVVESTGILKALLPATVDTEAMGRNRILPGVDDKKAVTAYKMLRTRVLQRMRANNWSSLLVTGSGPNEGKTVTASNLAISISKDVNRSAILVDLDLQRPSLADYFGLNVKAGLSDFLSGDAEIDDIVYAPEGLERLVLIPNQTPIQNSSDLIASPRMHELIAWTRDRDSSTITIFDMPPVLVSDDVLVFCEYVDAVMLLVSQGMTDRQALKKTVELLGDNDLIGVVMNRSTDIVGHSEYSYE